MSLTAAAIRLLASKGLSATDIADIAEANATDKSVDNAAERRKAYDRERKAKARAEKSGGIPVEVHMEVPVESPAEIHRIPAESRARVRDNITNSVDIPNLTTLNSVSERVVSGDDVEWPPVSPPDRRYLDRLGGLLRQVAGAAINQTAPNLMVLAPILALGAPGNGPICELYADILPTIAARCAKARPNSITQWGYFTEAIREARDRRLAGAPAAQEVFHERPDPKSAKFERRQASHAADFAGSELAVDLRAERRARYL
jgi:hypothetical protein